MSSTALTNPEQPDDTLAGKLNAPSSSTAHSPLHRLELDSLSVRA